MNENAGREDSVTATFNNNLFYAALRAGKTEAYIALNGSDRHFNADSIFRAYDHFVLVESKSANHNIRDESKKDSACRLCVALDHTRQAEVWHRQCHYIMWGVKKPKLGLQVFSTIYQDAVCNINILPNCRNTQHYPSAKYSGDTFARDIITGSLGLANPDFVNYLRWLISLNPDGGGLELPTKLYASSLAGGIASIAFNSFSDLANWAAPALSNMFKDFGAGPTP